MPALRRFLERKGYAVSRVRVDDTADYHRLYPAVSVRERRFYNIGAGSFVHPCWTNIDFASDWYGGIQGAFLSHDLLSGEALPIADGTAEIIYTSHTVEHVPDEAGERLFRNAFAALKPHGVLRVTCPDADLNFRALQAEDAEWFYWDEAPFDAHAQSIHRDPPNTRPLAERWLHHHASQLLANDRSPSRVKLTEPEILQAVSERGMAGALDHFTGLCQFQPARIGNHVTWWSAGKLIEAMRAAGFRTVYRSGYRQSAAHVLRNAHYFDSTHPGMSVYVEAVR